MQHGQTYNTTDDDIKQLQPSGDREAAWTENDDFGSDDEQAASELATKWRHRQLQERPRERQRHRPGRQWQNWNLIMDRPRKMIWNCEKNVNNSELWNTKKYKGLTKMDLNFGKKICGLSLSSVQYTMFDFVSLCVTYIASCSFCYALLSILNSAPLYSSPCSYTFILPLSMLYLMNLWIFCKVRSTSLILPNLIFIYWTLLPLCDIFLDISILAITIDLFSNKGRDIVFVLLVNVYIENCTISCSHFTIIASVITLSYQFLTLALTFLLWPLSCLITPHKHPIFHLFISFPLPPSPSSHMTVNILMIM